MILILAQTKNRYIKSLRKEELFEIVTECYAVSGPGFMMDINYTYR